jgi:hypothetical protein
METFSSITLDDELFYEIAEISETYIQNKYGMEVV